ncbi:MAG: Transcriptional regulator, AraC family, partial [uncultured Solirubrobacteraceae bacterium]
ATTGPRRSGPPAARPRPDGSRLRPAARRPGPRTRSPHVAGTLLPQLPGRVRRDAVQPSDDPPHRAGEGPAAPRGPHRDRGLLRGGVHVAGIVQHALHRARRREPERLPGTRPCRRRRHPGVHGQAPHQTGQEWRSERRRPAV